MFSALHMGPYQSIAPLEPLLDAPVVHVVDGIARQHRAARGEPYVDAEAVAAAGGAEAFLAGLRARVVVRGTSDDVTGPNLEAVLTIGAAARDIPVVAVEDFPGNFRALPEGPVEALCIEADAMRAVHEARGVDGSRIYVTGNPRYDALRSVDRAARRETTRAGLGLWDERVVLWVGQPDGAASYATLEVIVPVLAGATLLFRAHPRDEAYGKGFYGALLQRGGLKSRDVSGCADVVGLCCAADLVITQFSSVAVEAGYLGTPALFVLLPDVGGAYIRKQKGYAIPPWCKENCAFLLDDAKMAAVVVDGAMHDREAREAVCVNFARRYATRPPSAPAVARIITAYLER